MTATISYEPFDKLIISLRNDRLLRESDLLHHMIYSVAWTTGSELIGELGHVIKRIRKESRNGLSDETKENMREAMEMVKRIWPDFPE
jgi:hypothetical protein